MLGRRTRDLDLGADAVRVVRWLAGAGLVMVLLADVSQMSKAEVERIWLPFVPWLLISCALLPERWRRIGVVCRCSSPSWFSTCCSPAGDARGKLCSA